MAPTLCDEKPEVGDLIEIFRGSYQHWAVYVGDGFIVHLTSEVPGAGANSMMSVTAKKAIVKKEKLRKVVGSHKWKISNNLDKKYKPRPAHVIVRQACAMVGRSVAYDVLRSNCEHFANELRYEEAESCQARVAGETLKVAATAGVGVAGGIVAGLGLVTACMLGGGRR